MFHIYLVLIWALKEKLVLISNISKLSTKMQVLKASLKPWCTLLLIETHCLLLSPLSPFFFSASRSSTVGYLSSCTFKFYCIFFSSHLPIKKQNRVYACNRPQSSFLNWCGVADEKTQMLWRCMILKILKLFQNRNDFWDSGIFGIGTRRKLVSRKSEFFWTWPIWSAGQLL